MPHIIQLSPHLANLIAAGEVVERPASVVKELVENAVDAGARTVTVEIQNGGMTFLRIQDDGCGMEPDEVETAFLRHATSKLRCKEDLEAIGTLGFRGEALAATAAVSRIDVLTRTAGHPLGVRLHLEAGKVLQREEAGCPVGTTIIVRDLFFNTPARMKFMKQDTAEGSAVTGVVQKQALAHPEISFRLIRDGQLQLSTPGDGALASAVYTVLGRQAAGDMVPVESSWEKLSVSGFVSRPTATRGNRTGQIFFVNHRYIRSKTLTAALEEAYRNQIMVGRFPACVLNLTVPLSAVDVNVHPAKTEVKFLREKELFDCVYYGVLGALRKAPGQVQMQLPDQPAAQPKAPRPQAEPARAPRPDAAEPPRPAADARPQPAPQPRAAAEPRPGYFQVMNAEEYRKYISAAKPPAPAKPRPEPSKAPPFRTMTRAQYDAMTAALNPALLPDASPALLRALREQNRQQQDEDEALLRQNVHLPRTAADPEVPPLTTVPPPDPESPPAPVQQSLPLPETPSFRVVGEVLNTYLVVEQGTDIIFIDKHAAHERILFEQLKARGVEVMGQLLLEPITCSLDREDAAALLAHRELLSGLGYDLDDLEGGTLLLRQIPADILPQDAQATLEEIAEHLRRGKLDKADELRDELLHTVACKAAIKAGYITSDLEREKLARQVLSREDLKYCPHGRPICVVLTQRQLEKQFKRIV